MCFLVVAAIGMIFIFRPKGGDKYHGLVSRMDGLQTSFSKIETNLREDFRISREENSAIATGNRAELNQSLKDVKTELTDTLKIITEQNQKALEKLNATLEEKVNALIEKTEHNNKMNREEQTVNLRAFSENNVTQLEKINTQIEQRLKGITDQAKLDNDRMRIAFKDFQDAFEKNLKSFNELQREKFAQLDEKQNALIEKTERNNKANREEQTKNLKEFSESNVLQLEKINTQVEQKLKDLTGQTKIDNDRMRETLIKAVKDFQDAFDKNMKSFNELQREKFGQLETKQGELIQNTEKRLEQMRETVDEKLQKTLNERLGQSFELVRKQLESVQKGLGDMQTLAQDVGGLKKVLSNVKMRGGIGEVQLAMLLEQVLAPEQYEANVKTKHGSSDMVEFAIKLPGRDDANSVVYLPVDAKFPKEAYEQLTDAYEAADPALIDTASKKMESVIKSMAKDIRDKYISPPDTTDFGIMFLPFEGIYAEVVRRASLLEQLQREYKVIVTGPTTLAAILNSLQIGFRTLALQKRSSEVWKILGAVKKEFENFGGMLEKARKNISSAGDTIEELMGKRTRAINRTLKGVEALPAAESQKILPDISSNEVVDD